MKYFMSALILAFFFLAAEVKACEKNFYPGELAVSSDGYLVEVVAVKSSEAVLIRTSGGQILTYQTQLLAKMRGCTSSNDFCVGDQAITADGNLTNVAGIFGCDSRDVAISVDSTQGGFLKYDSQYLTKLQP